jgi:hypothetical protein
MKFRYKLQNPRKDQVSLTMDSTGQSLIPSSLAGSMVMWPGLIIMLRYSTS